MVYLSIWVSASPKCTSIFPLAQTFSQSHIKTQNHNSGTCSQEHAKPTGSIITLSLEPCRQIRITGTFPSHLLSQSDWAFEWLRPERASVFSDLKLHLFVDEKPRLRVDHTQTCRTNLEIQEWLSIIRPGLSKPLFTSHTLYRGTMNVKH